AALSSGAFSGRLSAEDQRRYEQTFLANFNAAVTENALKWHAMERERGPVDYAIVDAILAWTDEHEIPLRGHNIFWGVPNRVQPWLKVMDDATLRQTLKARALDIGRRYRGRFAEYDLNNEMIHANYYTDRLGPAITKQMADWVKQADPAATLYFNDYDVLTGNRLMDYIKHIRGLLEQGTPMAGIGVQGHLHGESFDPEALQHALNELAKIALPIRITEFNMPGQRSAFMRQRNLKLTPQQEQARAKALTEYYRICFAHPAVEGILMWGFWEGANWIRQSSLYRRDWTPTPAVEAYRDLLFKQWWTQWEGKADANRFE
ncbi:MAG: endo-1,4-beta-xylanase, partial [Planctomycetota bacterium]